MPPPEAAVATVSPPRLPVQRGWLAAAGLLVVAVAGLTLVHASPRQLALLAVGLGLGIALYHSAFGFTAAYGRAFRMGDVSGVAAQLVMLALATVLFAPVLAAGQVFGHGVTGAVAPVSLSMAFGALLFGVAMQIAGGCASGTLYTAGGGNLRMLVVLVFFCLGCFAATFHLGWWQRLPGIGAVSLAGALGWPMAVALQLAAFAAIYLGLRRAGGTLMRPLWWTRGDFRWIDLVRGSWPLLPGAVALAGLSFATLLIAGFPWTVTWGLTLWAAKAATLLGWQPAPGGFWSGGFPGAALARPLLADPISLIDLGILGGALTAAALAGRLKPNLRIPLRSAIAAAIGGFALGYGARLAYGCNIGAFFAGVASTSLHGWVWIAMALAGNWLGLRLRPLFRLDG